MDNKQLTAAYRKDGEWIAACIEEIPGVNTQGRTLDEARRNLEDALSEFLAANSILQLKSYTSCTEL